MEELLPGETPELRSAVLPDLTTGPMHTEAVMKNGTRAGVLTVYHDKVNDDRTVAEMEVDLRGMSSGEAILYRGDWRMFDLGERALLASLSSLQVAAAPDLETATTKTTVAARVAAVRTWFHGSQRRR